MAEEAIREAEALGAAPEWVQWRRSQIAYHRGMYVDAVVLEQAAQKMPTNLAANWLLACVYASNHDYDKVEESASRSNRLPVNEEEEYLYKGILTVIYRPEEGLALLDKAVAERGSLIAFTQRASALARVAFEKTDFDRIQQAMDDITAAKRVMRRRDNAMVLTESVFVHHLAAILYQQNQKPREFEKALRIADTDAQALAHFPSFSRAVGGRGIFLADNQQEQEALQWYEEGLKHHSEAIRVRDAYAWLLYQRGEAEKALQVIGQARGLFQDFARAVFVAELPDCPRRARKICDAMSGDQAYKALFLLGQKEAALELLRSDQPNDSHELGMLHAKLADYYKNPDAATMKSLLDFASRHKGFQISAHFAMGVRQLAEGDRVGALQHFQEGVAVRHPYWVPEYNRSRAFLVRMQKDPTWPPWIPVKK
jgi:tetratricopeptide (TPR) repeat protein